jgi:hypothetical protein
MKVHPWTRWLGPPIAIGVVALTLSQLHPGAEAGGRTTPASPGACAASPIVTDAAGKPRHGAGLGSWWKLGEHLDGNGELAGRQLAVGRGGATTMLLDLPVESVASGPIDGSVVVATDDGRRSELRLVSVTSSCSWLVDSTEDVVRGAILDPSDGSVIAHLVSRATRSDLGTWRFGAPGALTKPARIATALDANALDGPAWITDLRLDPSGGVLAVQSCTDTGCLTRVFDLTHAAEKPVVVAGGRAGQHGPAAQGPMLGLTGGRLVTWAACSGFPCRVVAWNLATGTSSTLIDSASAAAMTADGRFLLATTDAASGRTLRLEIGTGALALVKGIGAGEQLLPGGVAATSGLEVADDEVAIAASGANPRPFRPAAAEVIP